AFTAMVGGLFAFFGGFDFGVFTIYLNYTKQVSQPLNQISMQINTILSALAGAERIFEVMDTPAEIDQGQITLVPVRKEGKALTPAGEGERTGCWAWKVPKEGTSQLVPVREDENGMSELNAPTEGCLWAWKYRHGEEVTLHRVRGAVRNEEGEPFYYTELKGAVRFNHVDFSYVPGKRILHDVTVYANPGQKIAFVGSTGAGKTTITNLINRFYEIENGMITFDGLDVGDIAKDSLRQALGAVLQDTHLFTGTVMENIRYGRLEATDEECIAAAKAVGAHSFIRRLPDGYNTMVTGDGANFSQGQRQLLAIARAAVADPPVMILDEATSSIDTRTEALVQRGMDALMEGRTVFVIAHRLSTVRNSDCIVVIEHGEIQEKGSHAQLLEEQGRYYQLYTGQFQLD
ncbi:MAG: ATP-binding cassette domain-containing protein, partial [Oscillospiraceae bacterium]|nr:ATP-binding cassette domain-containing protein [Oscillospiraceae bacterium]